MCSWASPDGSFRGSDFANDGYSANAAAKKQGVEESASDLRLEKEARTSSQNSRRPCRILDEAAILRHGRTSIMLVALKVKCHFRNFW